MACIVADQMNVVALSRALSISAQLQNWPAESLDASIATYVLGVKRLANDKPPQSTGVSVRGDPHGGSQEGLDLLYMPT